MNEIKQKKDPNKCYISYHQLDPMLQRNVKDLRRKEQDVWHCGEVPDTLT